MRISDISDVPVAGGMRELSGMLRFGPGESESQRVFFRRPDPGAPPAGAADALFVAHLVSAMAVGEDLVVEGPVSSDLLERARAVLVPRLLAWHPRLSESAILVEEAAPGEALPGAGTGSLFSGGVDPWFTFVGCRSEVSHLVHIHGFEIHSQDEEVWRRAHAAVRAIADEHGKQTLPVVTNVKTGLQAVRRLLKQEGRPWRDIFIEAWYGGMLAASALSLRPTLRRIIIPSSWSQDIVVAIGSHPLLEPEWSTASLRVEMHGDEIERVEKLRSLAASSPEVFDALRVCIENAERSGGFLNCGRCVKCVRTLVEMRVSGISPRGTLFRYPLDLDFAMRQRFPGDPHYWYSLAERAEASGDAELRDAIRVILDEKWHTPRLLADLNRVFTQRGFRIRDVRLPRRRGR